MKTKPSVKVEAASKRAKPNFTGVPGEIVSTEGLELEFYRGLRKASPYDALLTQLAAQTEAAVQAGKERPALKFGDRRARASVGIRAKKKGFRVTFAEHGGALYARIEGSVDEDTKGSRRERLLAALKVVPGSTTQALTILLRDKGDGTIDKMIAEVILAQMAKTGEVVRGDGDQWRLNPSYRERRL